MTPEQRRALAAFLRHHLNLKAENRALMAILATAAQDGNPPIDWPENLETLRHMPEYRAVLEEFEPLIVQLEQGAAETDLIELLQKTLGGRPPN